jgi:release factor glutamine methyltransferase
MVKTYVEVLSGASSFLEAAGKEGYAIEYLFLARKNWDKTQWLLHMREEISAEEELLIEKDMADLMKNIPPQYLLGYEYFFEHRFKVTKDTLIPRPETEELVALCLSMNDQQGKKGG